MLIDIDVVDGEGLNTASQETAFGIKSLGKINFL